MKPVGRATLTMWSSPVTGFFRASPRPSATPSMRNVLLRPLPSIVIFAFTRPTTLKVGPSSSHGSPPSWPVKIWESASTCLSVVGGSTMKAALPSLMDRLGPHEDPGALHAREVDVAAAPLRHGEADERAAAAVLRVREAAEVAATAEVAVAEF